MFLFSLIEFSYPNVVSALKEVIVIDGNCSFQVNFLSN